MGSFPMTISPKKEENEESFGVVWLAGFLVDFCLALVHSGLFAGKMGMGFRRSSVVLLFFAVGFEKVELAGDGCLVLF